jgi:hypothetical protein
VGTIGCVQVNQDMWGPHAANTTLFIMRKCLCGLCPIQFRKSLPRKPETCSGHLKYKIKQHDERFSAENSQNIKLIFFLVYYSEIMIDEVQDNSNFLHITYDIIFLNLCRFFPLFIKSIIPHYIHYKQMNERNNKSSRGILGCVVV